MDLTSLARDERADLVAFLETLAPEQWNAPTLCAGWRVRDLVAHVVSYDAPGAADLLRRFAKGRCTVDGANAAGVAEFAGRTPDELLALLREHLRPQGVIAAFGGGTALTGGVIHHQDIRRPLGAPRGVPAERLVPALRGALRSPLIRGSRRARGLRLVATDLDWTRGSGPEVRGPGEALLMAVAGRRGAVEELEGPGRQRLASRIG